jgi:hypothetical protein
MEDQKLLFVKGCLIGDGSLTPITREGRDTIGISFTHCLNGYKPRLTDLMPCSAGNAA